MNVAEHGLHDLLLERLIADEAADDTVSGLVLAAWAGDQELTDAVEGRGGPAAERATSEAAEHPNVYLAAVHVEGFRGIGAPATLPLRPGPGLTLVTGRNGSGKSSFAEAAELVLTGTSRRWENRTSVWRDGWRNIHTDDERSVAVDLITAGISGTTRIEKRWEKGAELDEARWTRQEPKAKRADFDGSSWRDAMSTYRPFLSYSELGALIDGKPSELHDALHRLLGLGALTAAHDRIKAARKRIGEAARSANAQRKALRAELENSDDPRITQAAALLKPTKPDLAAIAELIAGAGEPDAEAARLRAVLELRLPEPDEIATATAEIRRRLDEHAAVANAETGHADRVVELLRTALHDHAESGIQSCPVCEKGTLDDAWRTRAAGRMEDLEQATAESRRTMSELDRATADARSVVQPIPLAGDVWDTWSAVRHAEGPAALAQALETAHGPARTALAAKKADAEAQLARLDEAWAPVARRLSAWHDEAAQAATQSDRLAALERADKWLADTSAQLRDQRLAPFAEQSRQTWQALRQQSNVELGPVRLDGAANRRRVAMDVRIDDVDGGTALGVMSQGELHALGLSLFLPRATVDQSPFRFVLIDDPVQAMDPAKVDGLARVLADVALTRQVVVFTHDDRLADAVRRLELSATIWEVARGERSAVEMRPSGDPIARYLDDARAMNLTTALPPDVRSELVASCCRSAIEAACHAKIRSARLGKGYSHAEVEAAILEANTTNKKANLAVFDTINGGDLSVKLAAAGPGAADAFRMCKKGAHKGMVGDLKPFIQDVEKLAEWLQT
ncbi:AAA domain-containing protein [Pseudonocardia ammonioxydans]|uniref:Nuclease SbcCD subunit C n=1 Tax=Pseudonocardia ammonioxydans TaxID=260086 RepID=A0A1I4ZF44_PSUAM|nr:AAA family ATPase [Pseudonocardia ammonioxydans]SFN48891.1 AAA domain-containing protein [Pseudonocardia ammonioxydans]